VNSLEFSRILMYSRKFSWILRNSCKFWEIWSNIRYPQEYLGNSQELSGIRRNSQEFTLIFE
jgi:hypothetical protein